MPFTKANGQELYFESVGSDAPALIFSHGLLMDREMYAGQVAHLSDRYRCVSWDQRGHGNTREDGQPFTYWDSAGDCLAVMDACGIEKAVLVGLSQGGFLSIRTALLAPDRVMGLILISTQAGVDSEETYNNFRGLRAEWSANGPANVANDVAGMLLGSPIHSQAWTSKWASEPRSRLGACIDTLIARDDITDRLGEIAAPTLVIHGDADNAIALHLGRALAESLADSRGFVTIAGAAHAPPITHADQVNKAIVAFLDGIAAR